MIPYSSSILGFPPSATQSTELEGAPSFAPYAKGGLLRSNIARALLLALVFLRALNVPPSLISVLTSFFFLFSAHSASLRYFFLSFDFPLSTSEPVTP